MALSAIAAYCLIRWKGSPSSGNLLLLACGVGGLLSCKYNYYLYFPLLALLGCAWLYFERPARAEVARLVLTVSAGCLLISGFWYIRNYILYDDILGQFTVLELMKEHQGRLGIQQPFGLSSLAWFLHREFFTITFRSTFAMFGYMSYPLSETVYQQFSWWLFAAVILFLVSLFRQADRREWFWFTLLLLLAVLQFGLLLYNAYVWDYQAQGRYLFPLLVPTALFLGYSLQQHRNQQLPISICTLAIALLLINSQKVLITEYRKGTVVPHPPIQARAAWDKTPAQPARARLAKNPLPALTEVNLLPNAKVEQQFVLNNQRLIGISVIVAPKVARTTNLHRLRLFDAKTDELLRESYLFPFEFSENNAVSFVFPTLETPTERVYRVELVALETVASPATSILCRPIDPPNILAAQINGSQISCALSLTLLFDQSGSL